MIILEGPDGSGKTSLAAKLQTDLGLYLIPKVVSSSAQAIGDVNGWVKKSLDRGFGPYLYDRHALISEPIYGPAWKGQIREGFQQFEWLATAYAELDHIAPVVICCLPPVEEVLRNIRKDPDNAALYGRVKSESLASEPAASDRHISRVPSGVGQIYWQYYARCAREQGWVRYDYTKDDYSTIRGFIVAMLEVRSGK